MPPGPPEHHQILRSRIDSVFLLDAAADIPDEL